jgi:hypothetical protein
MNGSIEERKDINKTRDKLFTAMGKTEEKKYNKGKQNETEQNSYLVPSSNNTKMRYEGREML